MVYSSKGVDAFVDILTVAFVSGVILFGVIWRVVPGGRLLATLRATFALKPPKGEAIVIVYVVDPPGKTARPGGEAFKVKLGKGY